MHQCVRNPAGGDTERDCPVLCGETSIWSGCAPERADRSRCLAMRGITPAGAPFRPVRRVTGVFEGMPGDFRCGNRCWGSMLSASRADAEEFGVELVDLGDETAVPVVIFRVRRHPRNKVRVIPPLGRNCCNRVVP